MEIYYGTIGLWVAPDPDELEQEYLAYYGHAEMQEKDGIAVATPSKSNKIALMEPTHRGHFLMKYPRACAAAVPAAEDKIKCIPSG